MAFGSSSGITSLGFNQDQGCFSACLKSGLRVYNVDPLVEKTHYNVDEIGKVNICEMVNRTNWLLIVKSCSPSILRILDDGQRFFVAEVQFKSPIRAVRARIDRVAVVLSSTVQVLALPTLERISLLRIPSNTRPLCSMSLSNDVEALQLIAAPAHRKGSVQLMDISRTVVGSMSSSPAVLGCHQSQLACFTLSGDGLKLATASERGTVIRLWDTDKKTKLYELRRGSDYAKVYCISFNVCGSLVCSVSDKGTVHVWLAQSPHAHVAVARYVAPDDRRRSRAVCAFSGDDHVVVVSNNGSFHKFRFSLESRTCYRCEFEYIMQVGDDVDFVQ